MERQYYIIMTQGLPKELALEDYFSSSIDRI